MFFAIKVFNPYFCGTLMAKVIMLKIRLNKNNSIYQILNFDVANELIDFHLQGQEIKRLFIWSMLNLNDIINK